VTQNQTGRGHEARRRERRCLMGVILAIGLSASAIVHGDDDQDRLKRLVDQVARGDDVEAAAAGERLVELITAPLAEAIGSLESRPIEEQVRLRRVLARVTGALRTRLFRIDLSPEDCKLFDAFAASYPELVERLFDGNHLVRKAAVQQIPLESNTGAGLLIAARVDDEDADVAEAALEMAARLHDRVVARALTRYIRDATTTVESGFYGPHQQDLAMVVAIIVAKAALVVADAEYDEGVPAVVEALRFFGRSKYWDHYHRSLAIRALGKLGDERAAPILLDYLDHPARLRWRTIGDNERAQETVGDVALLSLLRIYELPPKDFALRVVADKETFAGYADDDARREGHRAFRIWHEQHAGQSDRAPASQPTHADKD
jgi:HEAT repeat protein